MQPVNNERPVHADLPALSAELARAYPEAQEVQIGEAITYAAHACNCQTPYLS